MKLEERICQCGCGAKFKVLSTSKQVFSSAFCSDTTRWKKGKSWKKSRENWEDKVLKPEDEDGF